MGPPITEGIRNKLHVSLVVPKAGVGGMGSWLLIQGEGWSQARELAYVFAHPLVVLHAGYMPSTLALSVINQPVLFHWEGVSSTLSCQQPGLLPLPLILVALLNYWLVSVFLT